MQAMDGPGIHSGDHMIESVDACQDGFKYKLIEEDGRYKFEYIKTSSEVTCAGGRLEGVITSLNGAFLDDIKPSQLEIAGCAKGDHCSKGLSQIVQNLQELLLQ